MPILEDFKSSVVQMSVLPKSSYAGFRFPHNVLLQVSHLFEKRHLRLMNYCVEHSTPIRPLEGIPVELVE